MIKGYPDTAKLHAIIEKTAFFIKDHGIQMEIVVKAKQSGNPQFGFLHFDDILNPYYKLILKAVRNGTYEPMSSKPATPSPQPSEDESDEEMELHPLLTASLRTPIRTTKKLVPSSDQPLPPGWTAVTTEANSWKLSSNTAEVSLSGMDVANMAMTYHPGYAVHSYSQSSMFPPPPPPPGVSQMEASDPEKQQLFPSTLPPAPFPPGMGTPLYPGNHGSAGVSLAASDMANYTVNAGQPIIPPPPDLKPICDKLAKYVARNGKQFEDNIKVKGDPRFDFLNETSDHYTYYHMKRKEYETTSSKTTKASGEGKVVKSLVPYAKPVSFQIKAKDTKRPVVEYRSTALFKSAKADESDEEETTEEQHESQPKDSCEDGKVPAVVVVVAPQPDVQGPRTQEDVMAEERTTKLKQEKEKEVQRLEEEANSTTSSLRRQVQLERRRRAQLFINMLKKTKPTSEESSSSDQNRPHSNNIFEPQVPN